MLSAVVNQLRYGCMQGTGKDALLFQAMQANRAEGISVCEAHPDLEVFRFRLGKALNYVYHEDSQRGLFQRRDPREGETRLSLSEPVLHTSH